MQQDDIERLAELEEMLEQDEELDEDEREELRDLRSIKRDEGAQRKLLAKFAKAKKVWRHLDEDTDNPSADGYMYALSREAMQKVFMCFWDYPGSNFSPEQWAEIERKRVETDSEIEEVDHPALTTKVLVDTHNELFWFAPKEA